VSPPRSPVGSPDGVRDAVAGDLPAITAIYAESVRNGTGTFELEAPDEAEMARRLAAVTALGLPSLVAEIDGVVAGYAYAAPFRTRAAYRFTVEDSIYIDPDYRGRGVGLALLRELIARCEPMGVRRMLGVIGDAENLGSVALHAACGFEHIGAMKAVGWKFERWLDVVLMQLDIGPADGAAPDGPGMALRDGPARA